MRYSFIRFPHFGQTADSRTLWFESIIFRPSLCQRISRTGSPLSGVTDSLREEANADDFPFLPYHFTYEINAAPNGQHEKEFLQWKPLSGPFE
jgi:hypothetical protein